MRRHFLVHVARVLRQHTLEHEIIFIPRILPFSALDRALKVELAPVNNFRRETQVISLELARLEKLIQKGSFVALAVAESRNESRDVPRFLHRQLHKFAFFQKRVHPRIRLRGFCVWLGLRRRIGCRLRLLRLLRAQFRRNAQQA